MRLLRFILFRIFCPTYLGKTKYERTNMLVVLPLPMFDIYVFSIRLGSCTCTKTTPIPYLSHSLSIAWHPITNNYRPPLDQNITSFHGSSVLLIQRCRFPRDPNIFGAPCIRNRSQLGILLLLMTVNYFQKGTAECKASALGSDCCPLFSALILALIWVLVQSL